MRLYGKVTYLALLVPLSLSSCSCDDKTTSGRQDFITMNAGKNRSAEDKLTGTEVLLRSQRAYSELQSYVGTIAIKGTGKYATSSFDEAREGKVFFSRPDRLRLETKDSNGDPIVVVCDGPSVWESSLLVSDDDFQHDPSISDLLLAFQGVTLGMSNRLPSILLDIKWNADNFFLPKGELLPAFATDAQLAGEQSVDGHACYRVVCKRELFTWTFWIDAETYLLRRIDESSSPEQMDAQRRHGGGGFSGRIRSTTLSERYTIEQVNVELAEELFKRPIALR